MNAFEKIIRRIMSKIGRKFCRNRGGNFTESVVYEVSEFLRDLNNINWDMGKNGELLVLERLKIISPKIILIIQ